jgi:flagellin
MRGQVRGLSMASKNSSDTISLIQTAEGARAETHSILQRMRELSVQSANDTNVDADRAELQAEVTQLKAEIDRIGNTTEFNTKKLLEGSATGVRDEIKGTLRVNNNSSVQIDANKEKAMYASIADDKSWSFDGAYMLIKVNQTYDASSKAVHNAEDYRLVGPDGKVFSFKEIGKDTLVQTSDLTAGTIVADGGMEYEVAVGALSGNATIPGVVDGITIGESVDDTQFSKIAIGSILASGSTVTLNDGQEVVYGASGSTESIKYNDGVLSYEESGLPTSVAIDVGKTLTLDNGTMIKNDGSGKFTIVSGSLELASDLDTTATSAFTVASQSFLHEDSETKIAGVTLVEATNYKMQAAGTLSTNVTIGNSVNLTNDEVTQLSAGSVLAKGSNIEIEDGRSITLNVNGKDIDVSWNDATKVLKVGDQVVAAEKSITLEDGTVLTHEATLAAPTGATGKITVTTGHITLAKDISDSSGTGNDGIGNVGSYIIAKDSTLATDSRVAADTAFNAGTVITAADSPKFSGSVTMAHGAKSVQFTANAGNALATNYFETKVGESFTFIFTEYDAASSNLNDSIMSQIGANSGQTTFLSINDMRCRALGVADVDISTKWGAATAIETVNNALQKVSHQRSLLGAMQNRLEHTIKNLDTAAENLQAAEARIRDVDMAKEVMEFTKTNILQQASQAMLAQANQQPQSVLQLLR